MAHFVIQTKIKALAQLCQLRAPTSNEQTKTDATFIDIFHNVPDQLSNVKLTLPQTFTEPSASAAGLTEPFDGTQGTLSVYGAFGPLRLWFGTPRLEFETKLRVAIPFKYRNPVAPFLDDYYSGALIFDVAISSTTPVDEFTAAGFTAPRAQVDPEVDQVLTSARSRDLLRCQEVAHGQSTAERTARESA